METFGNNSNNYNDSNNIRTIKQNVYYSTNQQEKNNYKNNLSNNIMPVNKKLGNVDSNNNFFNPGATNPNNLQNLNNSHTGITNYGNKSKLVNESPFNRKNILPANKFIEQNNENLDDKNNDLNNPNLSINIINHNYSHYYLNPDKQNLSQTTTPLNNYQGSRNQMNNTNSQNKSNKNYVLNATPSGSGFNKPTQQNNYNPVSLQNYKDERNDMQGKYGNINLFRVGHSNSYNNGNNVSNNNPNNNLNNKQNPNRKENLFNN